MGLFHVGVARLALRSQDCLRAQLGVPECLVSNICPNLRHARSITSGFLSFVRTLDPTASPTEVPSQYIPSCNPGIALYSNPTRHSSTHHVLLQAQRPGSHQGLKVLLHAYAKTLCLHVNPEAIFCEQAVS